MSSSPRAEAAGHPSLAITTPSCTLRQKDIASSCTNTADVGLWRTRLAEKHQQEENKGNLTIHASLHLTESSAFLKEKLSYQKISQPYDYA